MASLILSILSGLVLMTGCRARLRHDFSGFAMVANRGEGTVSFINPSTLDVTCVFHLPDDGEPMYLAYDYSKRARVLVSDRKSEGFVVAELRGSRVEKPRRINQRLLPLPAGAFHSITTQVFVDDVRLSIGPPHLQNQLCVRMKVFSSLQMHAGLANVSHACPPCVRCPRLDACKCALNVTMGRDMAVFMFGDSSSYEALQV